MKKFFKKIITVSLCSAILLVINPAHGMQEILDKENLATRKLETAQNLYRSAQDKMNLVTKLCTILEQDPTKRSMGTVDTLRQLVSELSRIVEKLQDIITYDALFDVKFKLNLKKNNFFENANNAILRAHHSGNNTLATIPPMARVEYSANKYMAINPETLSEGERHSMIENITVLNTLFNEKVLHDTQVPENSRNELRGKLIALARQFTRN